MMIYTTQPNTYKDTRQLAFNIEKIVIKKKSFESRRS